MYWQISGDVPSHVGPMDSGDHCFFMPAGLAPDVQVTLDTVGLTRWAAGIDLPFEILSIDDGAGEGDPCRFKHLPRQTCNPRPGDSS